MEETLVAAKPASKRGAGAKRKKTEPDKYIMDTNDSSIVSKRSVAKLYLTDKPDFFEPFVQKKFQRRHPLINRGYWLRMRAIDYAVLQFREGAAMSSRKKVIVNLGCGYDPLPFRSWHNHPALREGTVFVDVDYPQLMQKKKQMILESDALRASFSTGELVPREGDVVLKHPQYLAVGCDLHQLAKLEQLLEEELNISEQSVLFVAEVSIAYMSVEAADAVIRWASSFKDSQFCLLEQCLPDGPNHPFAQTMIKHFDKLRTPLRIMHKYPTLTDQRDRFMNAGWPHTDVTSLWKFWSSDRCVSREQRKNLDFCERFDEWEEFALFGSHYFLLLAGKASSHRQPFESSITSGEPCAGTQSSPASDAAPSPDPSVLRHNPLSADSHRLRRFAAALVINGTTVALHGGLGAQTRLKDCQMYPESESSRSINGPPLVQALMCHTITNLNDDDCFMVGGRASPAYASSECWFRKQGKWVEVQPLSPGRYRHCAVKVHVNYPEGRLTGVLVYGGKSSSGEVLNDWNLWTHRYGWQAIQCDPPTTSARFGAALGTTNKALTEGVLLGGMASSHTIVTECLTWRLYFDDGPRISCNMISRQAPSTCHKYGTSLVQSRWGLLLIGGISPSGYVNRQDEILAIHVGGEGSSISATRLDTIPSDSSRPLLVGSSAATLANGDVIIAGGGAVCFSFGSFWNTGYRIITHSENHSESATEPQEPTVYSGESERTEQGQYSLERNGSHATSSQTPYLPLSNGIDKKLPRKLPQIHYRESADDRVVCGVAKQTSRAASGPGVVAVPRVLLETEHDFEDLLSSRQPAIIQGLDIGSCTRLWTLDYLEERIGADHPVIVHSCPTERMTFQTKNFSYIKQAFGEFLKAAKAGERLYLRSIASKQPAKHPANLEKDFPTIAEDFRLPSQLVKVTQNMHSSPLRISGPVTLWLHYDVMANVLCQVRGTKTLRLYPPADVPHLDFPPGASSSNTNVFTSDHAPLRYTHPHEAVLRPGDVLFIPPLWAHTATPTDGVSVAVNVFFRDLEEGYAAGRDVYGNRDLQAYENGRRDIEKIVKSFEGLPKDMSRFYLERLVGEFKEKAEL